MTLLFHFIQTCVLKWTLCELVEDRKANKNLTQINSIISKQNALTNSKGFLFETQFCKITGKET